MTAGTGRGVIAASVVLALVWLPPLGLAASGANPPLGALTNDAPTRPPLGAFRHTSSQLHQGGKAEVLVIDTYAEEFSAAERWPVVKALERFGTFSSLKPLMQQKCYPSTGAGFTIGVMRIGCWKDMYATFDWESASYRSRYVAFVHKDLIDPQLHVHQNLSRDELTLFNRYENAGGSSWPEAVWQTVFTGQGRGFPLLLVGRYLETSAQIAIPGDLTAESSSDPLPFDTVEGSLRGGRPVGKASPSLITDFNTEANLITALICHADGKKPSSVCNRPVIRKILGHVKATRPMSGATPRPATGNTGLVHGGGVVAGDV